MASLPISLVFWATSATVAHARPDQNQGTDTNLLICVYPLSGQYGLLQRLIFYAQVLFAVFAHEHVWLVAGALASALTYSATAALHALLLAVSGTISDWARFDADIIGTWAIVSAGWFAVVPAVEGSSMLRGSRFRPIIFIWTFVIFAGIICSTSNIYRQFPLHPLCEEETCVSTCYEAPPQLLRSTSQLVAWSEYTLFNGNSGLLVCGSTLTIVLAPMIAVQMFGSILKDHIEDTPAATAEHLATERGRISRTWQWIRETKLGQTPRGVLLQWKVCIPIFLPIVIFNEVYLLSAGGVPSAESAYAIDQWAPWVGAAFVLIAAMINEFNERRRKSDSLQAENTVGPGELEAGRRSDSIMEPVVTGMDTRMPLSLPQPAAIPSRGRANSV